MLGQLSDSEAEPLEAHLASCSRCDAAADGVMEDDGLIEAMRARSPVLESLPGTVIEDLMGRVRKLAGWAGDTPPSSGSGGDADDTFRGYDFLGPAQGPDELGSVGPYRILKVLGRGGMGVVFQARQPRPLRLVALKMILDAPALDPSRLSRFLSEAEAVARLQHPNIVQVYEAGEHRGRPFFAMEFVDGGNLAQNLAVAPLPAQAAAQLVQTLARATQHAHERGIVHRDLKPANVLLQMADGRSQIEKRAHGDAGEKSAIFNLQSAIPKIADFGLAKQRDIAPDGTMPEHQTESGAILGTPGYMAPEQALDAREIGPSADVYALGAILYEALTGRPPFKAASVLETLEQVRTQEPVPPGRLQPGLPRDLQTICLTCLAKEPARRYATARDLADDLGRYLRGEPIHARPVPRWERAWKWVRRKPAAAALLFVSVLSLAALVAGDLVYRAQLEDAVEQAETNAANASRERERADAGYVAARDTLKRMLDRLETRRVREIPQFRELQRALLEDALVFYQAILDKQDSPDPAVRRDTAGVCWRAATIQLLLGRPEAAAKNLGRAIALIDSLPAEQRALPENQALLAGCHNNLGLLANRGRRWDDAERQHRQALEINETLAQTWPKDRTHQLSIAETAHNLGALCQVRNRPTDAAKYYSRAIQIRSTLFREDPGNEAIQCALADDYVNLGLLQQTSNQHGKVEASYEKAEALLRPLVKRYPPGGEYALSLSALCINWGYFLRGAGRPQPALTRHNEAVDLVETILKQEPQHFEAQSRAYNAHGARAQAYEALGRWEEAVKDWDRVVELDRGPNAWERRLFRALALARAGEVARAVAEAQELEAKPEVTAEGHYNLACVLALAAGKSPADSRLSSAERKELAERAAKRAVSVLRRLHTQGYFNDVSHRQVLKTDEDLQALRQRMDFRQLVKEINAKPG